MENNIFYLPTLFDFRGRTMYGGGGGLFCYNGMLGGNFICRRIKFENGKNYSTKIGINNFNSRYNLLPVINKTNGYIKY